MVAPFDFGFELAKKMKAELPDDHVACKTLETYGVLADMVYDTGDDDYLEIGTWRGASAIIAARVKEEYNLYGLIHCVDDFGGYETNRKAISSTIRQQAFANMKKYGIERQSVVIYDQISRPIPDLLNYNLCDGLRFGCLFIDGNHWGNEPMLDFEAYQDYIDKFILFDDCDDKHPAVQIAVKNIDKESFTWKLKRLSHSSALFERICYES